MKPHSRSDGIIGDYCDASLYKSIPLFSDNEHNLQIIMFYDEMEVALRINFTDCYYVVLYRSVIHLGLKQVFTN